VTDITKKLIFATLVILYADRK